MPSRPPVPLRHRPTLHGGRPLVPGEAAPARSSVAASPCNHATQPLTDTNVAAIQRVRTASRPDRRCRTVPPPVARKESSSEDPAPRMAPPPTLLRVRAELAPRPGPAPEREERKRVRRWRRADRSAGVRCRRFDSLPAPGIERRTRRSASSSASCCISASRSASSSFRLCSISCRRCSACNAAKSA